MGVDVGNRLDARKRKDQRCVGSGMSVGVGVFGSVLLRHKGVRGFRDVLDASWLGMEPEGSGLSLGARE